MRRIYRIAALCFVFSAWGSGVCTLQAQPFPSQTIQLVIPAAPGDGGDIAGRALIEELTKILKTPIVAVNKPGAAAAAGTDFVAKSKKDGYTLLYGISAGVIYAPALHPETVPYDPLRDLESLGFHAFFPCAFSVQSSSPWKSFREVIDYAKKNPGKFRCSVLGVGSINHLQLEMMKSLLDVDITMVPFKGASPAVVGLLGGHVEATFVALAVHGPQHASGELRALLVDRKVADMPDVPTLRELGYAQDLPSPCAGIFAPAGIPDEARKVLVPALEQAIKSPQLIEKMKKIRYLTAYKPPEEHRKLWIGDYETAKGLAKKVTATQH